MNVRDYLKEKEVLEYLSNKGTDYSIWWLRRCRLAGGGIPFVKLAGGKVRYRKSDIDAWIESFKPQASTSAAA